MIYKAIITLFIAFFIYCCAAFVGLDFNFTHWDIYKTAEGRFMMIFILLGWIVIGAIMSNAIIED
jgi:hypothetical protein